MIFVGMALHTRTSLLLVLVFGMTSCQFVGSGVDPDIKGPYCAVRPDETCCPGRDDECTMPILDTICYCDIFCNETALDCCPDFWGFCLGLKPPPSFVLPTGSPHSGLDNRCVMDGKTYEPGTVLPNNCNECTCEPQPDAPGGSRWTCTNEACAIRPELITLINDNLYGWKAANYSFLWGSTLQHGITYRLGTLPADIKVVKMSPLKVHINDVIPDRFDAREQWPGLIHGIRDQGDCGASWAFSTSAVASDRLAIVSKGILKDELSPQHLLSCDTKKQVGCKGGYLDRAWWFMRKWGTVTEECYPYESGLMKDVKGTCLLRKRQVDGQCPSGVPLKKEMRLKMGPPYRIRSEEREIMKEIIDFGPVQATFEVKADFYMYKSGIYKHTDITETDPAEFRETGFHSVKIIGWGEDVGSSGTVEKYWVCANSWGVDWGEQGYFRILRGVNESGIESFVVGSWGRLHGNLRRLRRKIRQLRRLRRHKSFNKKKLHYLISLNQ